MTAKIPKELPKHEDVLGSTLAVGNYVAVSRHNAMVVCIIGKMTPKQMRVHSYRQKSSSDGWLVYSKDTVLLTGPDALAYILKHAK